MVIAPTFHSKVECTLCASTNLRPLSFLSNTPIANALEDNLEDSVNQELIPLDIVMCANCSHIQIGTLVSQEILFANYPYLSNSNSSTATRLNNLAQKLTQEFNLDNSSFVIEIGSNDGYLLGCISKCGAKALGIDPAITPTAIARGNGIDCITDYFSSSLAKRLKSEFSPPTLIVANNVLAHTHELRDVFEGVRLLMNADAVLVMEFSYAIDIFEKFLFDTIYHEHISYHTLEPLITFLKDYDLEVFRFERFDAHGGSARVYIKQKNNYRKIEQSVIDGIAYEKEIGIHNPESWKAFNARILELRNQFKSEIDSQKANGKRIVGYGVPAKFSTLFYTLGLNENDFEFIVDDNPLKIGKYAPGTSLKIRASSDLSNETPDCIVLFSWNYSQELLEKVRKLGYSKESIVIPLPNFEVHSAN